MILFIIVFMSSYSGAASSSDKLFTTGDMIGIAVALFVFVLTGGVLLGVLLSYCTFRVRRSREFHISISPPPTGQSYGHHEYINTSLKPPSQDEYAIQRADIQMARNEAYAISTVRAERVEMKENVAYGPVN